MRKLTFYGKIQIIKTLLIPKFTYLFSSVVVPKAVSKKIESMFFKFLWEGKREKIRWLTLIGKKDEGGLEMIYLESYIHTIKLKWIKALTDETDANWKLIPRILFEKFGQHFFNF